MKQRLNIGCMEFIIIAVYGFILMIIYSVIIGMIFSCIWNLFIPMKFGLPELNLLEGIGIIFLSRMVFGHISLNKNNEQKIIKTDGEDIQKNNNGVFNNHNSYKRRGRS